LLTSRIWMIGTLTGPPRIVGVDRLRR